MNTNQEKKTTDISQIISQNLKIARRNKGLNLKEVGKILNVSFQQAQKYETGACDISISKLVTMAKALSLPITFFFQERELIKNSTLTSASSQHSEFCA